MKLHELAVRRASKTVDLSVNCHSVAGARPSQNVISAENGLNHVSAEVDGPGVLLHRYDLQPTQNNNGCHEINGERTRDMIPAYRVAPS